ncbi:hypothetical protein I4U23_006396 [Adineta vaga]|nr:hypothetical protein I4U23_006396 [Adineta vaga]
MSDTSIVGGEASDYDFNGSRPGCWNRIGANICVVVLAIITIILAAGLGYMLLPIIQGKKATKVKGANKSNNPAQKIGHGMKQGLNVIAGESNYDASYDLESNYDEGEVVDGNERYAT